jgi:hypothetical protein
MTCSVFFSRNCLPLQSTSMKLDDVIHTWLPFGSPIVVFSVKFQFAVSGSYILYKRDKVNCQIIQPKNNTTY